jgi:arylsulfatase A-like enzyme
LIIKPAGQADVKSVDVPVQLMDVTATLMHLMAGKQQERMGSHPLHGQSLLPLLSGNAVWPRKVHYAEYHGDWYGHYSSRMVSDGRWKLVWNLSDYGELYDLAGDPYELRNLFYDPAHAGIKTSCFALLRQEAQRWEDAQLALLQPELEDALPFTLDGAIS